MGHKLVSSNLSAIMACTVGNDEQEEDKKKTRTKDEMKGKGLLAVRVTRDKTWTMIEMCVSGGTKRGEVKQGRGQEKVRQASKT